jgi:hypothetical protein
MSSDREPTRRTESDAGEETEESVESVGQTPTADGAPLVTEEGVDEGAAELAEQDEPGPARS